MSAETGSNPRAGGVRFVANDPLQTPRPIGDLSCVSFFGRLADFIEAAPHKLGVASFGNLSERLIVINDWPTAQNGRLTDARTFAPLRLRSWHGRRETRAA